MRFKTTLAVLGLMVSSVIGVQAAGPEIGAAAPDFTLTDTNGKSVKLSDYKGKTVVLEWTNFGCPFVAKHYDATNMQALQQKWTSKGIVWLSICSSAKGKEGNQTAAEWNEAIKNMRAKSTAFLLDESGSVGKLYDAKTTPHMFIINGNGNLVYKGAIDDKPTTKSKDIKGAKNYVDNALTELTSGKTVTTASTDPYGCSVKYAN